MTLQHPTGKGYFIWQLDRCGGGDPVRLAAMAAAAGLSWVAIKVHNGVEPRNGDIARHVHALQAAGVAVWGWGYVYGASPEAEARLAIERCRAFGLAGYIINAEVQYKAAGMATRAVRFMGFLQDQAPELVLGLCTYRFPSLHPEFPWSAFLAGCAFHMPQVYWLENNNPLAPADQLGRSLVELRALRELPVVPLGVSSPNDAGTWRPSVVQLNNFNAAVRLSGLPGVGWWSWQHAENEPAFWAAISAHAWRVAAPAPVDPLPGIIRGHARSILEQT